MNNIKNIHNNFNNNTLNKPKLTVFKAKVINKEIAENSLKLASAAIAAAGAAEIAVNQKNKKTISREEIIEMAENGTSARQIAIVLGTYEDKVRKILKEAGIKTSCQIKKDKCSSPEIKNKIIQMAHQGKNPQEIAKEIDVSYVTILNFFKAHGLKSQRQLQRKKGRNAEVIQAVIDMAKNGQGYTEISENIGLSVTRVQKILQDAGIKILKQHLDAYEYANLEKLILEKFNLGMSAHQISKELNLNTAKVTTILNKCGHQTKYQEWIEKKYDIDLQNQIIELATAGKTSTEISKILNIGLSTILQTLKNAGIKTKAQISKEKISNPTFQKAIIKMYSSGMNIKEIARSTEISTTSIREILDKAGVRKVEIKVIPEKQQEIIELAKQGFSANQISDMIGIPIGHGTVLRIINKAGISTQWQQELKRINSEEFRAEVISRFESGQTSPQIANALSIGNKTVVNILNSKDIKTPRQIIKERANDKKLQQKAIELAKSGKNLTEIEAETGIGNDTLTRILTEAGITTKAQAFKERINDIEVNKQIIKLYSNGKSTAEISNITGISLTTILKLLNKAGYKTKQQRNLEMNDYQ